MAYNPMPPLGQAANAASLPVTLSTEQNAYLDGIEGLLATIDADTGSILTSVDGIETLVGTTNTTLTTIDGRVDGIEGLLTTIDGRVDGLETSNSAIQTAVELIDNSIFVAGTGTYAEATSTGQLILAVRRDADTTLVNTTNEMAPLIVDANGYLKVEVFSGGQNIPVSAASGAFASGSIASGAIASGAIASGAIAAGAIAAGATSIATTEDTASAAADHLVKVAQIRLDTPVANANVSNSGDYTQFIADNFGKTWTAGAYPEDIAHIAGEAILGNGARRIDTAASSAGTSGDWATLDASAEGALWVTPTPTTTSGLTIFRSIDLDETEEEIKATAGNVYSMWVSNLATSTRFVKFYNATAANVTVGSTTPVITIAIPGNSTDDVTGFFGGTHGIGFGTAITVAATTGVADADTGAPGANEVLINVFYK